MIRSIMVLAGLVAAGVPAAGVIAAWHPPAPSGLDAEPRVREIHEIRIAVAGATIRALCTDGRREVVLLHGGSSSADTWRPVLARLDSEVGACAYDRRGSGESAPPPEPRGWFEFVDELRQIHASLGLQDDYVMVGHSLGGYYARLYAIDRPYDLSGLLLVDPGHEELLDRLKPGMPDDEWARWDRIRGEPNEDGVVEARLARRTRRSRLPDIPVTVLTASVRQDGNGWNARFVNEAARQVHASILQGVSAARHLPAPRSGHDIQQDQPGLVADEIMRLVRAARR